MDIRYENSFAIYKNQTSMVEERNNHGNVFYLPMAFCSDHNVYVFFSLYFLWYLQRESLICRESGTPWTSTHYSLRDLTTWRVVLTGTAHIIVWQRSYNSPKFSNFSGLIKLNCYKHILSTDILICYLFITGKALNREVIRHLSPLEEHCFSRSSAYQWVRIVPLF